MGYYKISNSGLSVSLALHLLIFFRLFPTSAVPKHIPGRAGGGWDEDESEAPSMRDSPYGASVDRISGDKR